MNVQKGADQRFASRAAVVTLPLQFVWHSAVAVQHSVDWDSPPASLVGCPCSSMANGQAHSARDCRLPFAASHCGPRKSPSAAFLDLHSFLVYVLQGLVVLVQEIGSVVLS